MSLLQRYADWSQGMEQRFLDYLDPSQQYKFSPLQELPMANFATVYAVCFGYLVFVIVGTAIMKAGVPAINTSSVQFLYNPLQVVICSYMCVEAIIQAVRNGYSATPCNAFNTEKPVMSNVIYFFFLSKFLDLFDTVFIILGKKWKQLSVLHVYHHLSIIVVCYVMVRIGFDADSYQSVVLNTFIHAIMYMYYFVSSHTHAIWWKKYLTAMQLIQFVLININGILAFTRQCDNMPWSISAIQLFYVQSIFWLFVNFFIRAYVFPKKKTGASTDKTKAKAL